MAAPVPAPDELIPPVEPGSYAGLVSRAFGLAIDAVIVQGGLVVTVALLGLIASLVGGVSLGNTGQAVLAAAWLAITALYFVAGWAISGQTPGMRVMGLAVVTIHGGPLSVARSCVRVLWLGLCILPLFAGFLPVLFDDRRRGVLDMVARTVVIHTGPSTAVSTVSASPAAGDESSPAADLA